MVSQRVRGEGMEFSTLAHYKFYCNPKIPHRVYLFEHPSVDIPSWARDWWITPFWCINRKIEKKGLMTLETAVEKLCGQPEMSEFATKSSSNTE